MINPDYRLKVFLSYAPANRDAANEIYDQLTKANIDVWFDQMEIAPGAAWIEPAQKGILKADCILLLIGRQSQSRAQNVEIDFALEKAAQETNFKIIPVLLPGAKLSDVPESLQKYQIIDMKDARDLSAKLNQAAAKPNGKPVKDKALEAEKTADQFRQKGDFYAALSSYQEILSSLNIEFGKENSDVGRIHRKIGLVQLQLEESELAKAEFSEALRVDLSIYGAEHYIIAEDYNNLAKACGFKPEDSNLADEYSRKAIAITKSFFEKNFPDIAGIINNRAAAYEKIGDFKKAAALYEETLSIYKEAADAKLSPVKKSRKPLEQAESKPKFETGWTNEFEIEQQLSARLTTFDWAGAADFCARLIDKIYSELQPFSESMSVRLLSKLRRKQQFQLMTQLAEALLNAGQEAPRIKRLYAQALIDQGLLNAAKFILQSIIQYSQSPVEEMEARGLLGRIYKQIYINIKPLQSPYKKTIIEQAINEYLYPYKLAPRENIWHGINVVALLNRARRDNISLPDFDVEDKTLALEILSAIEERERESVSPLPSWDRATKLEALLALGRYDEAENEALIYTADDYVDAFEIGSTLRQLEEVWQINDQELPGKNILPIFRAALFRQKGATIELVSEKVKNDIDNIEKTKTNLGRTFASSKTVSINWYQTALERAKSIARIERRDGRAIGTGWLVDAGDFFPDQQGRLMVITAAHVISPIQFRGALSPELVRVNFQLNDEIFEIEHVFWSSPPAELDTTFVILKGDAPKARPLPIAEQPLIKTELTRLYIIGYPGGRSLEFSLQDNYLLDFNDKVLHYRTPTEPGSAGSPVFEQEAWEVVALHHASSHKMRRLNDPLQTYEAKEGISIQAIRRATLAAQNI